MMLALMDCCAKACDNKAVNRIKAKMVFPDNFILTNCIELPKTTYFVGKLMEKARAMLLS